MEFVYPKVTVDDLLKYAKAGDHAGVIFKDDGTRTVLTPKEHAFAEFLYDIDTILAGHNMTFSAKQIRDGRDFLKNKSEAEVRAYLQGQIDTVVAMYCDRYLPYDLCERKSISLDESGKTCMDPYVMQHILSLNGFSIDNFELFENGNVAGKVIPIKFTGEFVDEEALREDFERKGIRGGSYLARLIRNAQYRDEEVNRDKQ